MTKIQKRLLVLLGIPIILVSLPPFGFALHSAVCEVSDISELTYEKNHFEGPFTAVHENLFPENYPDFLKQFYIIFRQAEHLKNLSALDRESILQGQEKLRQEFFRSLLQHDEWNIKQLYTFTRAQVGEEAFETFLTRFGIHYDNDKDIELEILAQINRMIRRDAYYRFVRKFSNAGHQLGKRVELVERSTAPRQLEYALQYCDAEEFQTLLQLVTQKPDYGPRTSQDRDLIEYLKEKWHVSRGGRDHEAALKWRAVIAQLISQRVGSDSTHLPFSKCELLAMMRNAERTLDQRRRPFIDLTPMEMLDQESASYAYEIIKTTGKNVDPTQDQGVIAYAFLDSPLSSKLEGLSQVYQDILANTDSGQTETTLNSVLQKKEILDVLHQNNFKCIDSDLQMQRIRLLRLIQKILEDKDEPYRLPFIRGIIFFEDDDRQLAYRFIEDFPMIVAGDTYPYQWKHDNEVNIALLLANVNPYQAAQAIRFIIYYGMWRGKEAKRIGLYGWLSQIIFGNRQTGKMPVFNNKTYYYCPDFRLRPTKKIDADNERNRTSEIMQLPFFGWTVWRVYEEMKKKNEAHALAFLKEVYPYVRANTEAIRLALDPFNEAVLSGRDAWVNGMDNAWYHYMVISRHLPERFIPEWAAEMIEKYRVDNRVDKMPGNPVDPKLARGRPSDYYYAVKFVFYNIIEQLGLDPVTVYHASPYNSKDAAITGVMARSLEAQIEMAEVLKKTDADVRWMSSLRGRENEMVSSWVEEIDRHQEYLDRMKRAVNRYLWAPDDKIYYNRDVTHMFPSIIEQQFCRITRDRDNRIRFKPISEYWEFVSEGKGGGYYVPSQKARDSGVFRDQVCAVSMDLKGNTRLKYKAPPQYWKEGTGSDFRSHIRLNLSPYDPFIVEQFCHVKKDESGHLFYQPNMKYWTRIKAENGVVRYQLNENARQLLGKGARKIGEGDLLRSPAIASFFPLFGRIPSEEQAFYLSTQVVDPWMWWPVEGIPIPTQPMMLSDQGGKYISNSVYDPDKYWLGPTWMVSTKPVMDGFYAYGYEMMYWYLIQRSIGTLQDGRAVEHWNPETGEVNTSNVNFPWAASCMAGSIWPELTKEERNEYLRRFHPYRHEELLAMVPNSVVHGTGSHLHLPVTSFAFPDVIPQ
jgi:hypothetical protein